LQDLVPDPLFLEFRKPPPGGLIGAIWAGHIAPPATCNPHIQVGVTQLAVSSFACRHDSRSNPPPARGGQANESTQVW
jgi:hypothetical protein